MESRESELAKLKKVIIDKQSTYIDRLEDVIDSKDAKIMHLEFKVHVFENETLMQFMKRKFLRVKTNKN